MRSRRSHGPQEHDYWLSYSDLLAGLLLVFILLLIGTLVASKKSVEHQQAALAEKERELEDLQDRVRQVLGVRQELIERLRDRFQGQAQISFDDSTGAVRLGSAVLFDEGSSRLRRSGEDTLRTHVPRYFEALLGDPDLRQHVDQIIFEGHTNSNHRYGSDHDRGYLFNLALSQERAYEAMAFVIEENIGSTHRPRSFLAANGYSWSRPVCRKGVSACVPRSNDEDEAASRRLEIRFRLKDEEALRQFQREFEKQLAEK